MILPAEQVRFPEDSNSNSNAEEESSSKTISDSSSVSSRSSQTEAIVTSSPHMEDDELDEEMRVALALSLGDAFLANIPSGAPPKEMPTSNALLQAAQASLSQPTPQSQPEKQESSPWNSAHSVGFAVSSELTPEHSIALPSSSSSLFPPVFPGVPMAPPLPSNSVSSVRPRFSSRRPRSRSPSRNSSISFPIHVGSNSSGSHPVGSAPAVGSGIPRQQRSASSTNSLPWLNRIFHWKQAAKSFLQTKEKAREDSCRARDLQSLTELVWKLWSASIKRDPIKERILLVDNLPMVDQDKREELETVIRRTFGELALVSSVYLPVETNNRQLKGYAFVELASAQKVDLVVRKMHRCRLKAPGLVEEVPSNLKSSLRSSQSIPRGTMSLVRYAEIDKPDDGRVIDFLQSKLIAHGKLTTKCHKALCEIFNVFGGDKQGALVATQLNRLQMFSNGKPLTSEQLEFAFKTYATKLVDVSLQEKAEGEHDEKRKQMMMMAMDRKTKEEEEVSMTSRKEPGLTLEGFLDIYTKQCLEAPLDTWNELSKLGYDLNLNWNCFPSVAWAIDSQANAWNAEADYALIQYVESIYNDCDVTSPVQLSTSHIGPLERTSSLAFRALLSIPLPAIRLRFELLRNFNSELFSILSLINFCRTDRGSLSYLLSLNRERLFHGCKMEFLYDILDKTSIQGSPPTVVIDRLKLAARKDRKEDVLFSASVSSMVPMAFNESSMDGGDTMFAIAFQQLRTIPASQLRQKKPGGTEPHFGIRIVFKGEDVQGEGGPYRQFFTDISKELQGGPLGLLIPCPNAQQGVGENRDKWILNPGANVPVHLEMFEFLGRLMGLAIRTGILIPLDMPIFFWKQLDGAPLSIRDLEQIDSSICSTLLYLEECPNAEKWERVCPDGSLTFVTHLSDKTRISLLPNENGENRRVTFENRKEYVRLVRQARFNESTVQINAIRKGLFDIVPERLISVLCTPQDLEWKICGKPHVDIHLLKRHTTCSGVSSDAPHIGFFWKTLMEFSQQERRGFLRFAWAQERLPVNDEEFERTKTRMMIKPFLGLSDPDAAFPKADTCFFNIMLPEYSSQKILRDRLLYAIYTDSHSMNADEPTEDELATIDGNRSPRGIYRRSSDESDGD